jgi:hypothetical protein
MVAIHQVLKQIALVACFAVLQANSKLKYHSVDLYGSSNEYL